MSKSSHWYRIRFAAEDREGSFNGYRHLPKYCILMDNKKSTATLGEDSRTSIARRNVGTIHVIDSYYGENSHSRQVSPIKETQSRNNYRAYDTLSRARWFGGAAGIHQIHHRAAKGKNSRNRRLKEYLAHEYSSSKSSRIHKLPREISN